MDRIDTHGDYSSTNCKWSTRAEQMGNRRNSIPFKATNLKTGKEIVSKNQTLTARELGLDLGNINNCLHKRFGRTHTKGWKFDYIEQEETKP